MNKSGNGNLHPVGHGKRGVPLFASKTTWLMKHPEAPDPPRSPLSPGCPSTTTATVPVQHCGVLRTHGPVDACHNTCAWVSKPPHTQVVHAGKFKQPSIAVHISIVCLSRLSAEIAIPSVFCCQTLLCYPVMVSEPGLETIIYSLKTLWEWRIID